MAQVRTGYVRRQLPDSLIEDRTIRVPDSAGYEARASRTGNEIRNNASPRYLRRHLIRAPVTRTGRPRRNQ